MKGQVAATLVCRPSPEHLSFFLAAGIYFGVYVQLINISNIFNSTQSRVTLEVCLDLMSSLSRIFSNNYIIHTSYLSSEFIDKVKHMYYVISRAGHVPTFFKLFRSVLERVSSARSFRSRSFFQSFRSVLSRRTVIPFRSVLGVLSRRTVLFLSFCS